MDDSIRVTCNACNHVIKAPRAAAGRRGKCPHCKNAVYVPTPADELEDIPLAPLDDSDREQTLAREAMDIAAALRREMGEEEPAGSAASRPAAAPTPTASPTEISESIVDFLLAMQDSNLQKTEQIISDLRRSAPQVVSRIQQMMVDAMPPQAVRDMPAGLYQGFLRKLQDALSE